MWFSQSAILFRKSMIAIESIESVPVNVWRRASINFSIASSRSVLGFCFRSGADSTVRFPSSRPPDAGDGDMQCLMTRWREASTEEIFRKGIIMYRFKILKPARSKVMISRRSLANVLGGGTLLGQFLLPPKNRFASNTSFSKKSILLVKIYQNRTWSRVGKLRDYHERYLRRDCTKIVDHFCLTINHIITTRRQSTWSAANPIVVVET